MAAYGAPPSLGLHMLLKESAPVRIKNMVEYVGASYVAPVAMNMQKAG